MKYRVMDIIEEDFGCEGRPEGYAPMDTAVLVDAENEEIRIRVADTELYEKEINVGDYVNFEKCSGIEKMEKEG
ncbi:MAG: hypothetical protein PHS82_06105 [Lachnospiraceae bacterium]|nr:hypothetical protein [Lachnospiraceae bacterium]